INTPGRRVDAVNAAAACFRQVNVPRGIDCQTVKLQAFTAVVTAQGPAVAVLTLPGELLHRPAAGVQHEHGTVRTDAQLPRFGELAAVFTRPSESRLEVSTRIKTLHEEGFRVQHVQVTVRPGGHRYGLQELPRLHAIGTEGYFRPAFPVEPVDELPVLPCFPAEHDRPQAAGTVRRQHRRHGGKLSRFRSDFTDAFVQRAVRVEHADDAPVRGSGDDQAAV